MKRNFYLLNDFRFFPTRYHPPQLRHSQNGIPLAQMHSSAARTRAQSEVFVHGSRLDGLISHFDAYAVVAVTLKMNASQSIWRCRHTCKQIGVTTRVIDN